MKIGMVAPLIESVPPKSYGGTERVVSYLTEELVQMGHDVTLFASGDSITGAKLEVICPRSLRLDDKCVDRLAHHILMLERVFAQAERFDLLHFHIDYLHYPQSRKMNVPHITTLHGRLDLPDLVPVYREFMEMPVVSISNSQRAPLPWLNWQGTVYHGLPKNLYSFHAFPRDPYLAFVGRISPEKRVDRAIQIAQLTGMRLEIAAKVDEVDRDYFEKKIKPLLDDPLIHFRGEVTERDKNEFLGNAAALLFPIDWPEPFGMVMIEAMACGTPVIAYPRGSVREVINEGATGFIVNSIEEAVAAVQNIHVLSRRRVREVFEDRFTANRMAQDYLALFENLVRKGSVWETITV